MKKYSINFNKRKTKERVFRQTKYLNIIYVIILRQVFLFLSAFTAARGMEPPAFLYLQTVIAEI